MANSVILVVDIGSSNLRTSAVASDGTVIETLKRSIKITSPNPGFVEFDAEQLFDTCLHLMTKICENHDCIGIALTNQRASTVVFDPTNSTPVSPGLSWQDLRTAPQCLALKSQGISLSPNQSATKIALILDLLDPERRRGLFGGTIDSWIIYRLTGKFLTDHTNAATTGLVMPNALAYNKYILKTLSLSEESLPLIMPSLGYFGDAVLCGTKLPILAVLGDQQASMLGQAVTRPGRVKVTFGTGAMANAVTGTIAPDTTGRLAGGTFPIVALSWHDHIQFGIEGIGLHAGSAVQFACDNFGIASTPRELDLLASSHPQYIDSEELFVPALSGLATPQWDFGALAVFTNLTESTTKASLAHAILKGIAHLGADLIESIENDTNTTFATISVDGGMTQSDLFLEYLANFTNREISKSQVSEATTLGAAIGGFLANGDLSDLAEVDHLIRIQKTVMPNSNSSDETINTFRKMWRNAVEMSLNTVPELSSIHF